MTSSRSASVIFSHFVISSFVLPQPMQMSFSSRQMRLHGDSITFPLARLRGLEPPTSTFAGLRSIPTELQAYSWLQGKGSNLRCSRSPRINSAEHYLSATLEWVTMLGLESGRELVRLSPTSLSRGTNARGSTCVDTDIPVMFAVRVHHVCTYSIALGECQVSRRRAGTGYIAVGPRLPIFHPTPIKANQRLRLWGHFSSINLSRIALACRDHHSTSLS